MISPATSSQMKRSQMRTVMLMSSSQEVHVCRQILILSLPLTHIHPHMVIPHQHPSQSPITQSPITQSPLTVTRYTVTPQTVTLTPSHTSHPHHLPPSHTSHTLTLHTPHAPSHTHPSPHHLEMSPKSSRLLSLFSCPSPPTHTMLYEPQL